MRFSPLGTVPELIRDEGPEGLEGTESVKPV